VAVLRGHTLAVTSVDWKAVSNGGAGCSSILASCSDDRTARIYNGTTLALLYILDTYDIETWHTLTYLVLNAEASAVCCSTQNGYLVIWHLTATGGRKCYSRRVHAGSIEGLVWCPRSDAIVSVSSDNTVHLYHYTPPPPACQ
jgi:WD40 repeat protein